MARNNQDESLEMKYSNNFYATKVDVQEDLGTNLVENIWDDVLKYRSNFVSSLGLKHIDGKSYNICLTPGRSKDLSDIERKLLKLASQYFSLQRMNAGSEYKEIAYLECLKSINRKYVLRLNDASISAIIDGSSTALSPQELQLKRYLKCLQLIERKPMQEIDDRLLGDFYSILTDNDELTEFYRTKNDKHMEYGYGFGKPYLGIPNNIIGENMDELFHFINTAEFSPLIKASVALYFMYYVKPFETYSEDIGILLFKKILAFNDYGSAVATINVESILNDDKFLDIFKTAQKSYDLTYILYYVCGVLSNLIDKALDEVATARSTTLKEEFYEKELNENPTPTVSKPNPQPTPKVEVEPTTVKIETTLTSEKPVVSQPTESNNQTTKEVKIIKIDLPKKEETTKIETQRETLTTKDTVLPTKGTLAFSNIPSSLTEEQAKVLEKTLLELEPRMTKAQAYFYARHCTLGMNYKINDFVEAVGCAYETARTSMDNLAFLGYYQKSAYKNKYIYTPIKKN